MLELHGNVVYNHCWLLTQIYVNLLLII